MMITLTSYILYLLNLLGCTVFSTIMGWRNLSFEPALQIALVNSPHTGKGAAPSVRALQQSQDITLIPSLTRHFPASCMGYQPTLSASPTLCWESKYLGMTE